MGKNKLARWAELGTFSNVFQPDTEGLYGKDHPVKGNWCRDIFRNSNPVILELGCGRGEYTVGLSSMFPGKNYIGIDIKGARMWRGAKTTSENRMPNAAFLRTRIEYINSYFAKDEVDEIWITFPDPHPGKLNSNKRLTCSWFLNIYRNFLKENGIVHLKTDNTELFNYTRNIAVRNNLQIICSSSDIWSGRKENDILSIRTHYENQFLAKGLKIKYLAFRLEKNRRIEDAPAKI
ncbi:MAG: tRNA (guanosine(46)-N7)-methyltransferase TrmB [Bacteroidota bacterium]